MGKPRTSRASRFIEEWLSSGTPEDPHTQGILVERLSALVKREVSQSSVSNIKSGSQSPRADLIAAFKVLLGIEAEWWLPDAASSAPALEDNDEELADEASPALVKRSAPAA